MSQNSTLPPKQRQAAEALLTGSNMVEAAELAGISRRTLYRFLDSPGFTAAISAGTDAAIRRAGTRLTANLDRAIDTLLAELEPGARPGAANRIRAAAAVIDYAIRLKTDADMIDRIEALEAKLN